MDLHVRKINKHTKIVATLGPASSNEDIITELFHAGVDVFRLNFSHGTHNDHKERYEIIRHIEQKNKTVIGVLADLQGPKLRVGSFHGGSAKLEKGQDFEFHLTACEGNHLKAQLPHPEIFQSITTGDSLLVDDGRIRMKVLEKSLDIIKVRLQNSGEIKNHKGVNIPGRVLPIPALTKKDLLDLEFALSLGVDWVALSFVQHPKDVIKTKEIVKDRAGVIAKIEKPSAVYNIEKIIELSDAVMVARGDLGVEVDPELVPAMQKTIVEKCRKQGKPVIVATQMLETMVENHSPTRAEASDVAGAVCEGADAVMLSAETAVGQHPVGAASIMSRICQSMEQDDRYQKIINAHILSNIQNDPDAISAAACDIAKHRECDLIITLTETGATAMRVAKIRPNKPTLAITISLTTARRLTLVHGISSVLDDMMNEKSKKFPDYALTVAKSTWPLENGQRVVITSGSKFGKPGGTNLLRIATLGSEQSLTN